MKVMYIKKRDEDLRIFDSLSIHLKENRSESLFPISQLKEAKSEAAQFSSVESVSFSTSHEALSPLLPAFLKRLQKI